MQLHIGREKKCPQAVPAGVEIPAGRERLHPRASIQYRILRPFDPLARNAATGACRISSPAANPIG
jgi:hypothetical protein